MLPFIVITALAFSVVVQSMNAAQNDTAVILSKRSNLTYDGAIDYKKTTTVVSRDLTRRAGGGFLGKLKQKVMGKSSVVSVPLHLSSDHLWIAEISLGNPPRPFRVVVDTGTSIFWVLYVADRLAVPLSTEAGPYLARHEERPGIYGVVYEDAIELKDAIEPKGIKGVGRVIGAKGLVDAIPDYNGVLGLALSVHDRNLATALPFVTSFLQRYSSPIFALYLALDGAVMHIGGTHPGFYTGRIEYHRITEVNQRREPQLWQIGGASIYVNGHKNVVTGVETVLDTGTWNIYGPPHQVEAIYKLIRGEQQLGGHYYLFPCNSAHNLTIRWKEGKKWSIDAKNFNLGQTDPSKPFCEGVLKHDPDGQVTWTLGSSFMMGVYTVFDATSKRPRVGFGKLKKTPTYVHR